MMKRGTEGPRSRVMKGVRATVGVITIACTVATPFIAFSESSAPRIPSSPPLLYPPAPAQQTVEEAHAKSRGCMTCHTTTDRHTMHQNPGVVLGCTDCHGGDT